MSSGFARSGDRIANTPISAASSARVGVPQYVALRALQPGENDQLVICLHAHKPLHDLRPALRPSDDRIATGAKNLNCMPNCIFRRRPQHRHTSLDQHIMNALAVGNLESGGGREHWPQRAVQGASRMSGFLLHRCVEERCNNGGQYRRSEDRVVRGAGQNRQLRFRHPRAIPTAIAQPAA